MNLFDFGILGIVFISCLIGFLRGLTKETLSLSSWISAGALTFISYHFLKGFLESKIQNPMMADLASIGITFVFFLVSFSFLSYLLSSWVQNSVFGGVDRSLGSLFGFARGVIVVCILEMFLSCFSARSQYPKDLQACRFFPLLLQGSDVLLAFLPAPLLQFVKEARSKHQDQTPETKETPLEKDSQKVAETLSKLEPKQDLMKKIVPTKQQKKQMDRLLDEVEEDEAE